MRSRALGSASLGFMLLASMVVTGCGNSHLVCPAASTSTCGCGPGPVTAACPLDAIPLLYATTSSNQILGFSINPTSGALTALPAITGPMHSQSVGYWFNSIAFADTSSNSVDSFAVNLANGTLTSIQGSPFSLGTSNGGPTGIAETPQGFLYATEPNGTIVGFTGSSNTVELGAFQTPLPGSPYPAGVSPSQIAFGTATAGSLLYASDPGDATGGILAYSFSDGSPLTPISGSPFPTLSGAGPSFVFQGSYSAEGQGSDFLLVSLINAAKVAVFAIDSNSGALTAVPGSPFLVGNGPGAIAEDNQNHVFVMNAGDHTVSALSMASNGVLTPIGSPLPVGTASGGMVLFGDTVFVADTAGSEIWILNADSATGLLTETGPPLLVSSPPLQLTFVDPLFPSR